MAKPTDDIDRVIANGRRLVAEAKDALAKSERMFAELNIDPAKNVEYLRKHGGEQAVQAVADEVEALMREVRDDMERRLHEPKARSPGRRPTFRNLI